jgi:carboxymethylenebutenolidase
MEDGRLSVLKGEGRVPILFGSTSVSVGSRLHRGYLARPDLGGQWPTILLVAPAWGVTSSIKDLCRKLARQGLAALAPDLYDRTAPARSVDRETAERAAAALPATVIDRDLNDFASFIANPAGFWSSAEHGFGVLGIGRGGRAAVRMAARTGAAALALVYAPIDGEEETLASFAGGVLGIYGRSDDVVAADTVAAVRTSAPHAEVVVYGDVGHDFLDDYGDTYDREAASDAVERLSGFFEKVLPPAPA